jgi:hypothetical protein
MVLIETIAEWLDDSSEVIYRVIQKGRSIILEVIATVIMRKKFL